MIKTEQLKQALQKHDYHISNTGKYLGVSKQRILQLINSRGLEIKKYGYDNNDNSTF